MKEQNGSPVSADQVVVEPVRTEPLKTIELPIERVDRTPVVFTNKQLGLQLAGILFRPQGQICEGECGRNPEIFRRNTIKRTRLWTQI